MGNTPHKKEHVKIIKRSHLCKLGSERTTYCISSNTLKELGQF